MPKHPRLVALGALCLALLSVSSSRLHYRQCHASTLRRSAIVRAVEQAKASVVNIHGRKAVRNDPRQLVSAEAGRQVNGMGTGIVIDERGYILTNYHVVEGVTQIKVTLADEQTLIAALIAHDPSTDLAIIKVDVEKPLPVIQTGTSSDLMPGEEVIAVGNAYGYTHTVTRGIISALHRSVQVSDEQQYQDLIQTDASINPGNSGGPLLNIDGEMIGINVAVRVGAQGIGFALPVDEAMEVAAKLLSLQHATASGVMGRTEFNDRRPQFVVSSVEAGSAGERAGLRPGDVITSVGEFPILRSLDWQRAMIDLPPGESISIHAQRSQESLALTLVLSELHGSPAASENLVWQVLGLRLTPVDASLLASVGETRYRGGLRVTAVRPEGPAAQRGVKRGDILVGMHKWETISLDNMVYILNSTEFRTSQPIKFFVIRGDETLYGHMRVAFGGE